MTPREVVIAALSHRETPVVPFQVGYTAQEYQKMLAYTGNQDFAAIGSRYLHGFSYDGYPTACPDRAEHFVDDYGVIWNRSGADKDIGVVDFFLCLRPFAGSPHEIFVYSQNRFRCFFCCFHNNVSK